jgi:hypothetical protein
MDTEVEGARSLEIALIENMAREDLTPIEPGTIALDASFAGRGDAAGCGFGAFQG